jgi:hypothetical protein
VEILHFVDRYRRRVLPSDIDSGRKVGHNVFKIVTIYAYRFAAPRRSAEIGHY